MARSCLGLVAVVTGASRGIGRTVALKLAAEGADVAVISRGGAGEKFGRSLDATLAEVRAYGRSAIAIEADLSDPTIDRAAIIDEVESSLGPVSILVNNAAFVSIKNVADWSLADLRATQEVNVWAPWELIGRTLPGMLDRGHGSIVNITTGAAQRESARPGFAGYGGTKAMLEQMTRCLAAELADTGVAAYALAPRGSSETELFTHLVGEGVIGSAIKEPLPAMADAVLALVTSAKGSLPEGVVDDVGYRSLDLLAALDQPVLDLDGQPVPGFSGPELPQRIAELVAAVSGLEDLRGGVDNRN
jgi:NAD(P)-dependent dehydrogenase (short-subunit alcohol dehydrogenase family)